MHKIQWLAGAACLVLSGSAFGQFTIYLDPESQGKSMTLGKSGGTFEYFPWQGLAVDCQLSPNLRFTVTETANGQVSRMDCASLKERLAKLRTEAANTRDAAKGDGARKYSVYSKSSIGEWKKERNEYASMGKAEAQVARVCAHGSGSVVAAKVVDASGHEKLIDCSTQ